MRAFGLVAVLFAVGCAGVDALDGDIEDPESCCIYYPFERKIVECIESFLPPVPDACVPVQCFTVEGTVCYGDTERRTWDD